MSQKTITLKNGRQVNNNVTSVMTGAYANYDKAYKSGGADTLGKLYKRPSYYKLKAENDIRRRAEENGGGSIAFWGANCFSFSAGYLVYDNHNQVVFVYETKDYIRYANLADILLKIYESNNGVENA